LDIYYILKTNLIINTNEFLTPNTCQISDLESFYENLFGRKTDGIFVEVGAFDGITWSNTSCLANRGWSGIYIEPVKSIFNKLVKNYENKPKITCLNLAIDREAGETTIYDMQQLSTLNPDMVKVYQSIL
jgi:hypothetical protein